MLFIVCFFNVVELLVTFRWEVQFGMYSLMKDDFPKEHLVYDSIEVSLLDEVFVVMVTPFRREYSDKISISLLLFQDIQQHFFDLLGVLYFAVRLVLLHAHSRLQPPLGLGLAIGPLVELPYPNQSESV